MSIFIYGDKIPESHVIVEITTREEWEKISPLLELQEEVKKQVEVVCGMAAMPQAIKERTNYKQYGVNPAVIPTPRPKEDHVPSI